MRQSRGSRPSPGSLRLPPSPLKGRGNERPQLRRQRTFSAAGPTVPVAVRNAPPRGGTPARLGVDRRKRAAQAAAPFDVRNTWYNPPRILHLGKGTIPGSPPCSEQSRLTRWNAGSFAVEPIVSPPLGGASSVGGSRVAWARCLQGFISLARRSNRRVLPAPTNLRFQARSPARRHILRDSRPRPH